MIPYFLANTPLHTAVFCGALMAATSLLGTAVLLMLTFALRAERHLYTLSLSLLLPGTGLSVLLPLLTYSAMTPFFQGILLLPLLLCPLSLPLRTLQRNWATTAQELGAHKMARIRFFWWPLLQKPTALTLSLSILFSIVQ